MAVNCVGMALPCRKTVRPSKKPNSNDMMPTPQGLPLTRITAASEIQPRPADMFSAKSRTDPRERYAPARPQQTAQRINDQTRIAAV